jgi:hypothetical protein
MEENMNKLDVDRLDRALAPILKKAVNRFDSINSHNPVESYMLDTVIDGELFTVKVTHSYARINRGEEKLVFLKR